MKMTPPMRVSAASSPPASTTEVGTFLHNSEPSGYRIYKRTQIYPLKLLRFPWFASGTNLALRQVMPALRALLLPLCACFTLAGGTALADSRLGLPELTSQKRPVLAKMRRAGLRLKSSVGQSYRYRGSLAVVRAFTSTTGVVS